MDERRHGSGVILLTLLIAFILTIVPLPDGIAAYRPEWVALALLYWAVALPFRVGIGIAWLCGLFLDILKGSLLGQHALALSIIVWIMLRLHLRLRMFPHWQQAIVVLVLLGIYQFMLLWVYGMTGKPDSGLTYWLPTLSGTALWPVVFIVLREVRRRYKVS